MRGLSGWGLLGAGAALAGFVAHAAHVPAGWLVGPMFVAVVAALAWPKHPTVPSWGRQASLAVVGGVLAASFRPSVVPLIANAWLPVVLVVAGTLLLSLGSGVLLSRLARLDGRTAVLGALPGAASGMLAMSDPLGADPRHVALMQYTRVVVVVFSAAVVSRLWLGPEASSAAQKGLQPPVPAAEMVFENIWTVYALTVLVAAVGAWAGTRLRLPAGGLMGPLLLGVSLEELRVLHLAWPPGVPQAAYLVLGLYVGLLFDRTSVRQAAQLVPLVLAFSVGLVICCAGLGWMLAALTPVDGLTAYLATTPGGIDSVAIMALGSGADAPLVLAIQTLRLLAVVMAGAFLDRWWS
ncbi:MAG: AbrB family transcriptional regulator [Actinomycetota bacterium]